MEFWDRSISDSEEEQREKGLREPEIFEEAMEREVKCSIEKRCVDTEEISVERDRELRSKEETLELLQKTPLKWHGSEFSCQFWRIFGFKSEDLKLNNFWASLVFPSGGGEAAKTEENRGG